MTGTPGKNPYRPGVGVRPLYLAGRDAPLRRFDAMLRAAPEHWPGGSTGRKRKMPILRTTPITRH